MADSIHVDFSHTSVEQCHLESVSNTPTDQSTDDHSDEHQSCHANHIHHYLLPVVVVVFNLPKSTFTFSFITVHVTSPALEVIKPPIRLS